MQNRPATNGDLRVWATAGNYGAGGNPWNGTPIKVDPGGGAVAAGYTPNVPPGAQTDNYYLNLLSSVAAYLDRIDVENWQEGVQGGAFTAPSGAVTWNGSQIWAFDSGAATARFCYSGQNGDAWIDDSAGFAAGGGTAASLCAASAPDQPSRAVWVGNLSGITSILKSGVWHAGGYTVPGVNPQIVTMIYDTHATAAGTFLAGGQESAGSHPHVWKGVLDGSAAGITATSLTLANQASYTGFVMLLASSIRAGSTPYSAVAISTAGAGFRQWYTTNPALASTWVDNGVPPFLAPTGLAWGDADGVFMCVGSNGKVYTSADGITWALRSSQTYSFTGGPIIGALTCNCLVVRGSLWVALSTTGMGSGLFAISYSADAGLTWTQFNWPTSQTNAPSSILLGERRFVGVGYDAGASRAHLVLSQRTNS